MNIAITGATGIVGRFAVNHLLNRGYQVSALHRPSSDRRGFHGQGTPRWIEGELGDTSSLSSLLEGANALVHCAFHHIPGRYRGGEGADPDSFWRINLGGTIALLEAAKRRQVGRVVVLSSRAVFATRLPQDDPITDLIGDDYPTTPDTHYGALKVATEELMPAFPDLCISVIRPTGVYGLTSPVTRSKFYGLVRAVLETPDSVSGLPVRAATEVHGADLAQAIEILLLSPRSIVRRRAFNCSDIVVDTRALAQRAMTLAHVNADLPAEAAPPINRMSTLGLRRLGWQPGGWPRLDATLGELIRVMRGRVDR